MTPTTALRSHLDPTSTAATGPLDTPTVLQTLPRIEAACLQRPVASAPSWAAAAYCAAPVAQPAPNPFGATPWPSSPRPGSSLMQSLARTTRVQRAVVAAAVAAIAVVGGVLSTQHSSASARGAGGASGAQRGGPSNNGANASAYNRVIDGHAQPTTQAMSAADASCNGGSTRCGGALDSADGQVRLFAGDLNSVTADPGQASADAVLRSGLGDYDAGVVVMNQAAAVNDQASFNVGLVQMQAGEREINDALHALGH